VKQDTEPLETVSPVVDTSGAVKTTAMTASPWDPLFNSELLLEKMVQMTGNSARFNSTSTDELMKMSLGHELKGLLLNYALATCQKNAVTSANEKMAMVDQKASIEKEYTATKEKLNGEMEALKAKYDKDVTDLKKEYERKLSKASEDHAVDYKKLQEVVSLKDEDIVVLTKSKEEATSKLDALKKEKENWEAEISSLEESVGAQYDVGFNYALD
jgi:cell division protein FtsB